MPDENELQSATNLAVTLAWSTGAVAVAFALGVVLTWVLRRLGHRSGVLDDIALLTRRPVRAVLMVFAASVAVQRTSDPMDKWRSWVDHTLLILLIAAMTWTMVNLVQVAERRMIARYGGGNDEISDADRQWRRLRTQVTVLRRLASAVVVLLGVAAILMTFPSFSDIGTTVFASAGVLSVVAGLAAQTSLGAVFAGMQIAFSGAIRVGDVVELEQGHWWGRIEEITLTYVVVRLFDERRLVLPCTYFTTTPFENWTRNATEIMGTVEFDVDFAVQFDDMRAELDRLLSQSDQWDGRRGVLQVTDAVGAVVRVRMMMSAPNAGALFDLRCTVREGMVRWIHHTGGMVPTQRIAPPSSPSTPRPQLPDTTGTKRVAPGSVLRKSRGRGARTGVRREGGRPRRRPRRRPREFDQPDQRQRTMTALDSPIPRFHLAMPVDDLDAARHFYGTVLGLPQGRSTESWVDWDLHGHQFVTHLAPGRPARVHNPVDGHDVPVPHFGLLLAVADFHRLAERLRAQGTQFVDRALPALRGTDGRAVDDVPPRSRGKRVGVQGLRR